MQMLSCADIIRDLLRAAFQNRKVLVEYVKSENEIPSWDLLLLTIPDLRKKYWQALVALHRELVPNYIGSQALYIKLWGLFKEVTLNMNLYQKKESLDKKLSEFCEEVKKPLQIFDIVYEIKNFDVGDSSFNFSNVEIFKLTKDYLRRLGLELGVSGKEDKIFEEWVGRSVAKTVVNVSDINRAYEKSSPIVNSVLNALRLVAVRERLSELDDEIFLWELGESITIPKVKPDKGTLLSKSYHRGFRPLIIPMNKAILRGLDDQKSWRCLLDGKLPKDIETRVFRAISWISHAVTSTSLDYKLVDLCTSLEIILLPDHKDGTKGDLIALRQVLVGQGTSYVPQAIWSLYEKRSSIIHSGTLEITNYLDYWHLLICCLQVLSNIIGLSMRNPSILKLKDLLGIVENAKALKDFIEHCELGIYNGEGISKIKKTAEKHLKKVQGIKS